MDPAELANLFTWRAVERLLGVLIGGVAIVLGYRLFMSMPRLPTDGEGRIELPGGVSIYVSRVGPGVFFALFGTAVVGLSILQPAAWEDGRASADQTSGQQSAQSEPGPRTARISYVSGEVGDTEVRLERDTVLRDLRLLRELEVALEARLAGDSLALPKSDTTDVLIALPRIKRLMLYGVWDEAWGDYDRFATWVREGAIEPPPDDLSPRIQQVFVHEDTGGDD